MGSGEAPPSCHPNTLLDLPDAVLMACMRKLADVDSSEHCSERACLAVCRQLLKLILTHHKRRLVLRLGQAEQAVSSRKSLLCLYKAFPELSCLKVELTQGFEVDHLTDLFAHPDADSASTTTGWLANISDICIQGRAWQDLDRFRCVPSLPQLVPDSVVVACPNLKSLRLVELQITPQQQACIDAVDAGLQQISLQAPSPSTGQSQQQHAMGLQLCRLDLQDMQYNMTPAAFQEQLEGVHSLQDLRMSESCMMSSRWDAAFFAVRANIFSKQLTVLHVDLWTVPHSDVTVLLSTHYPVLQGLSLQYNDVDDTCMELLLQNMPRLQELNVKSIYIRLDYSKKQCNWQKLNMDDLDTASLPHLPAGRALSLLIADSAHVRLVNLGRGLEEDLSHTAAAVAFVERCGGLNIGYASIHINIEETKHMEQVLLAAMPLLRCCWGMTLDGFKVSCALLAALGKGARIKELSIQDSCVLDPNVWRYFMKSLPQLKTLYVGTYNHVSDDDLLAFGVTTTHDVTLGVSEYMFAGGYEWENYINSELASVSQYAIELVRLSH